MHYDEIEECGEMLANVGSFGMSNENLLHQDEFLMVWRIEDNVYYVVSEEEILASTNNQVMCEKTKQHQLISKDKRLYLQHFHILKDKNIVFQKYTHSCPP